MPTVLTWAEAEAICRNQARRLFSPSFAFRGVDVDDLEQAALIRLAADFLTTDAGIELPDHNNPAALVNLIARRAIVDELRRTVHDPRSGPIAETVPLDWVVSSPFCLTDAVPPAEAVADLRAALKQLPERTAFVVAARAHGYTNGEIAERLGVSYVRVSQINSAAVEQLRALLGDEAVDAFIQEVAA
jgi:RNA polymerase sigma factor (sigma-70 family)